MRFLRVPPILTAFALVLAGAGCSDATGFDWDGPEAATGIVVDKVDDTPLDGGITLTIERKDGRLQELHISSIFRPDATEKDFELVQKARKAAVGMRVWATGEPSGEDLRVDQLFYSLAEVIV